ncbi:energy transducer TonB [Flavobacterium sp.]|uniref:energy transducer TonB n=1 Tax=Flavobacterium sp. TaxID=239 RepID=UPI003F69FE0E
MKPNVKMKDKSQNSFIFFQIGLIATLMVVFFVLEMNFETKSLVINKPKIIDISEVYQPTPKVITEDVVKQKEKPVAKVVKPIVVPKVVINNVVASEEEIKEDITKDATSETIVNEPVVTDANETSTSETVITNPSVINHPFAVESLPMFPNCINTNKEAQKECFEKELTKRVYKNLVYPRVDMENKREGKVYFEIIVDENGYFSVLNKIKLEKSSPEMRNAVEASIKKLPKIIPAKIGGKGVKIRYSIPIVFSIQK